MPEEAVINDDADRALFRILLRYALWTLLALTLASATMIPLNAPFGLYWKAGQWHDVLRIVLWDMVSIFVVLLPFFRGTGRVFAERLKIGRILVGEKRWREAAAALEPFSAPGQRFLDATGEAHALLAQAYAALGNKNKADAARAWQARYRPRWGASPTKSHVLARQENASLVPKPTVRRSKPRRRF